MATYLISKYSISDYDKWQKVFEHTMDLRSEAGLHSPLVMRSVVNPLELTILHKIEDVSRARAFVESRLVRDIIMSAGVTNVPEFIFLSTD